MPRFEDGLPFPGEAIRLANELFDKGKDDAALELLHRCRNECAERGMMSSVQTLSNEILFPAHAGMNRRPQQSPLIWRSGPNTPRRYHEWHDNAPRTINVCC